MNGTSTAPIILELKSIRKEFGTIVALKGVSFTVSPAEIVGLVGDNGAGKSTLVKIIAGVHKASRGDMFFEGKQVVHNSPSEARDAGIETVFQDLALIEIFDVAENIFLGREKLVAGPFGRFGFLRQRQMKAEAIAAIKEMGIKLPGIATSKIGQLSGGQRQAVSIARAAFWQSKLLLLDEPTAALGVAETAEVERLVKRITTDNKLGTLIISHDMPQVSRMCDKVVVMRQGHHVATLQGPGIDPAELVGYITGAKGAQAELAHAQ